MTDMTDKLDDVLSVDPQGQLVDEQFKLRMADLILQRQMIDIQIGLLQNEQQLYELSLAREKSGEGK